MYLVLSPCPVMTKHRLGPVDFDKLCAWFRFVCFRLCLRLFIVFLFTTLLS